MRVRERDRYISCETRCQMRLMRERLGEEGERERGIATYVVRPDAR
jgi:hypothetical protein